jgi:hypothetical protein
MPTPSEPRLGDIRRIAFVTQRFLDLQGLIPAAMGAGWLFAALMHHAMSGPTRSGGVSQVLIFGMIVTGPATVELQKLYRRTFGEVVASARQKLSGSTQALVIYAGIMTDLSLQMNGGRSGPSFAAIALASHSIVVVLRDWPWRSHYLVAAAAGIVGAIVTASVPSSPSQSSVDPAWSEAYLLAFTLMGLGLVGSGLFDHQLLASSLRRPESARTREPSCRPVLRHSRLMRAWIAATFAVSTGIALRFADSILALVVPTALMFTLVPIYILPAILQIRRGLRDFGKRTTNAQSGPTVDFGTESLVLMFLIALSAAVDSALFSRTSPALLTVTLGLSSVWLAVRNWRGRKHYLLGAIGAVVVLSFIPHVHPARAFAILVFVTAAVVMLESLLDYWIASPLEAPNADPI